jgi:hypothetical protein
MRCDDLPVHQAGQYAQLAALLCFKSVSLELAMSLETAVQVEVASAQACHLAPS